MKFLCLDLSLYLRSSEIGIEGCCPYICSDCSLVLYQRISASSRHQVLGSIPLVGRAGRREATGPWFDDGLIRVRSSILSIKNSSSNSRLENPPLSISPSRLLTTIKALFSREIRDRERVIFAWTSGSRRKMSVRLKYIGRQAIQDDVFPRECAPVPLLSPYGTSSSKVWKQMPRIDDLVLLGPRRRLEWEQDISYSLIGQAGNLYQHTHTGHASEAKMKNLTLSRNYLERYGPRGSSVALSPFAVLCSSRLW